MTDSHDGPGVHASGTPGPEGTERPAIRAGDRVLRLLERIFSSTAILSMVVILGLICFSVILRYGFNTGVRGSHELIEGTLMPALVYLPLALTMREGTHPRIDLFYEKFSPAVKRVVDFLVQIISLVFWVLAAYAILTRAVESMATYGGSYSAGFSIAPHFGLFLVGFGIILATLRLLWLAVAAVFAPAQQRDAGNPAEGSV